MRRVISVDDLIFLGIKGTVIALDRRTGGEVWRTTLKGMDFVNVAFDRDCVLATARGEVFCLEPLTGAVRWHNPLTGMGWGMITLAGASIAPAAQHRRTQQAASSAAAVTAAG